MKKVTFNSQSPAAFGQKIHVAENGDDSNSGSAEQPLLTVARAAKNVRLGALLGKGQSRKLEWSTGGIVRVSPGESSSGLDQAHSAQLPDGRIVMIFGTSENYPIRRGYDRSSYVRIRNHFGRVKER